MPRSDHHAVKWPGWIQGASRMLMRWWTKAAVLAALGICIYAAGLSYRAATAIRLFRNSTSPGRLIGRTPEQIKAFLGNPSYDSRVDGGTGINHRDNSEAFEQIYEGPYGDICEIDFVHGAVTNVGYSGK
jgi:hypothetical protein